MDSYMFQTVGQDAVHLIAQALGLPLFQRTIRGTPVDTALSYFGQVAGDETEDLAALIDDVMRVHAIDAVSVGAIASNYQRTRVENVYAMLSLRWPDLSRSCQRLGLTVLAFLWQRDQSELLDNMATAGLRASIIKVAGAGLNLTHLGADVTDSTTRATLERLRVRFGLHPCGEGGEYETFTIACPLFASNIDMYVRFKPGNLLRR